MFRVFVFAAGAAGVRRLVEGSLSTVAAPPVPPGVERMDAMQLVHQLDDARRLLDRGA